MKRPVKTIITITVALVLFGSVAYAAEKKKQAKLAVHPAETTAEEEALQAELLAGIEEQQEERIPGIDTAESVRSDGVAKGT